MIRAVYSAFDSSRTQHPGDTRLMVLGVHPKPACTLKMADADFLAMMEGSLPAMQAYTSGKLKIEGDIMKSQLLEKLFSFGKK